MIEMLNIEEAKVTAQTYREKERLYSKMDATKGEFKVSS